jgi:DNA primase
VSGVDFDAIRRQVPLSEVLFSLGLELSRERDTYRARCPLHNEQRGRSLIIYPDGRWFCHGKCAATYPRGGDVIDMAGLLWGMADKREVIETISGRSGN